MTVLKSIASVVTHLKKKFIHTTIKCERCLSGAEAQYCVHSDVVRIRVCNACADEAARLGLKVVPIHSNKNAA